MGVANKMIYISIDTETTGLTKRDKVICFGMVAVTTNDETKEAHLICTDEIYNNVDIPITAGARNVHGISNEMLVKLSEGKLPYQVANDIEQYLRFEGSYLVGYNIFFDLTKIQHTYPSIDIEASSPYIDVMSTATKKFGRKVTLEFATANKHYDLDFARENISVKLDGYHSAVYDAYCAIRFYLEEKGYTWTFQHTGS